jgi:hypothetical protein
MVCTRRRVAPCVAWQPTLNASGTCNGHGGTLDHGAIGQTPSRRSQSVSRTLGQWVRLGDSGDDAHPGDLEQRIR